MYGLQFFGQVTVQCVRILDRIVRKRRAAAKRFYQIPSCIRVSLTGIIVFLKNIRLGASTPSHALQRVLCQGQFSLLLLNDQASAGAVSFFLRFGRRTSVVARTPTIAPPIAAIAR